MLPITKEVRKHLVDSYQELGLVEQLQNIEQKVQWLTAVRRIGWSIFIAPDMDGRAAYFGPYWSPAPIFLSGMNKNVSVFIEGGAEYESYKAFLNKAADNIDVFNIKYFQESSISKEFSLVVFDNSLRKTSKVLGGSAIEIFCQDKTKQLVWIADDKFSLPSIKQRIKKYITKSKVHSGNEFENRKHMLRQVIKECPMLKRVGSYPVAPNSSYVRHICLNKYKNNPNSNGYYLVAQRPSLEGFFNEVVGKVQSSLGENNQPNVEGIQVLETGVVIAFMCFGEVDVVLRVFLNKGSVERTDESYRNIKQFVENFSWSDSILPALMNDGECYGIKYSCERRLPGVLGLDMLSSKLLRQEIAQTVLAFLVKISGVGHDKEGGGLWDYRRDLDEKIPLLIEKYPSYSADFDCIRQYVIREAEKYELPAVWLHGDFNVKNILFSHDGKMITGLIDWDNAVVEGVPFIDLIHFLGCNHRYKEKIGVGQVVINILQREGLEEWELKTLRAYAERTNINYKALNLAAVMYWITHIYLHCARNPMEKKGGWMSENVIKPMQFIKEFGGHHG